MPKKTPPNTKALAEIFGALNSEPRLAILAALANGPLSVMDLAERIKMGGPSTSQHLSRLRAVDLVEFQRQGQMMYYRLAEPRHPAVENTLLLLGKG